MGVFLPLLPPPSRNLEKEGTFPAVSRLDPAPNGARSPSRDFCHGLLGWSFAIFGSVECQCQSIFQQLLGFLRTPLLVPTHCRVVQNLRIWRLFECFVLSAPRKMAKLQARGRRPLMRCIHQSKSGHFRRRLPSGIGAVGAPRLIKQHHILVPKRPTNRHRPVAPDTVRNPGYD